MIRKQIYTSLLLVIFLLSSLSCDVEPYEVGENNNAGISPNTFEVNITITIKSNQNNMLLESAYVTMSWETSLDGEYQISSSTVSGYTDSNGSVNLVSSANSAGVNTYDHANITLNVSASGFNPGSLTITSGDFEIIEDNSYTAFVNYTFYLSPQ